MTIDLKTLENLDTLSPEDKEAVIAEANEKYSQLQSATTKGIENMNKAIAFEKSVAGDIQKIKELHESQPEVAKLRLEKFRSGKTLDEVVATEGDVFNARVNEVVEQKEVDNIIKNYTDQIPAELKEEFTAELKDFAGDKKLTLKNVEKIVGAALNAIAPKMDAGVVEKAKIAAIGAGGNKSGGTNPQSAKDAFDAKIKAQSNEFLKNAGIL